MKKVLAGLAMLGMAAALCAAQSDKKSADVTRSISGMVTLGDSTTPATGAIVFLKNLKSLEVRSFITKEKGEYHFSELSPDIDYEVHAESKSEKSPNRTLSSFDSRKAAVMNLKLPAGQKEPTKK